VFVANLPFNVDDDALAAIFTNLSIRVKSASVVRGLRKGRGGRPFRASRGFGFVEIEDSAQQREAVEKVEGSLIGDRKISAKVANEMKPIEMEAATDAPTAAPV
jgi:RNA recognition motif-containing protein